MFVSSLVLLFVAGTTSAQPAISRSLDIEKAMQLHGNLNDAFHTFKTQRDAIPTDAIKDRDHGSLRRLDESWDEDGACASELASVKSQLEALQEKNAEPSYLFVQMANDCTLSQVTTEDGGKKYTLSTADMDDDTYSFTDRPYEIAGNMTTVQFFKEFDSMFTPKTGGKPNAAMTFHHENTSEFEGPLIAIQVEADHTQDDGIFTYELAQTESQAAGHALEDFFVAGDGVDGEVKFTDCSIFIDSVPECPTGPCQTGCQCVCDDGCGYCGPGGSWVGACDPGCSIWTCFCSPTVDHAYPDGCVGIACVSSDCDDTTSNNGGYCGGAQDPSYKECCNGWNCRDGIACGRGWAPSLKSGTNYQRVGC